MRLRAFGDPTRTLSWPRALAGLCALPAVVAALGLGCAPATPAYPEGTTLVADAAAIDRLLGAAGRWRGTPLARTAAAAREKLAACAGSVSLHCPPGEACAPAERLRCGAPGPAAELDPPADADWILTRELSGGGHLVASGTIDAAGGLVASVELPVTEEMGVWSLLAPAGEAAGPAVLESAEALLHLRLRPDGGLDLSPFVAGDGWGARVFQLQSELFLGAALAGVWELAVYPPADGERIPPVALALDHRDRRRAVQVMEAFVERILATWPARRGPFEHRGHRGACLGNLRVLPELTPCYVATERALVIGWNERSVALALAAGERPPVASGAAGALWFDRLPVADRRLAEASGGDPEATPEYPWSSLLLTGSKRDGAYRLELILEASP